METETLIGTSTAGLLFVPTDYVTPRASLLGLWRRHLIANAAVRGRDYMEALFKSHFPHCRLLEVAHGRIPHGDLQGVDNIVLLFPDSIGADFGWIERTLAARWPLKRVLVLNGRRRLFRLDPAMRRRLVYGASSRQPGCRSWLFSALYHRDSILAALGYDQRRSVNTDTQSGIVGRSRL